MMKFNKQEKEQLIEIAKTKNIFLEGNIIKLIEGDDENFQKYLTEASEKDKESRRKRLEMTKQIQAQNRDLIKWKEENENIQKELRDSLSKTEETMQQAHQARLEAEEAKEEAINARNEAEKSKEEAIKAKQESEQAKNTALNDLDILQKRTQNELIGVIVRVALYVIVGVAILTTGVYLISMFTGKDTSVIASTWSNIIGILLTNAFSIIGTIMGVKYASGDKKKED